MRRSSNCIGSGMQMPESRVPGGQHSEGNAHTVCVLGRQRASYGYGAERMRASTATVAVKGMSGTPARFVALLLLVLSPVHFAAQYTRTPLRTITGTVNDAGREPIRGAVVQIEAMDTLVIQSYETNETGTYHSQPALRLRLHPVGHVSRQPVEDLRCRQVRPRTGPRNPDYGRAGEVVASVRWRSAPSARSAQSSPLLP